MKFGTNEGTIDRVIRVVLGIALAAVALSGTVNAPFVYLVWVVAAIAHWRDDRYSVAPDRVLERAELRDE